MQRSSSALRCTRLHRAMGREGDTADAEQEARSGMGTPAPIAERERQGRTEMDGRLHCSETSAMVEAKC